MPNDSQDYVIKTQQGNFRIKAPKGTPPTQVLSQAVSASPKFAQVYPQIQSHEKVKGLIDRGEQELKDPNKASMEKMYDVKKAQEFIKWRPRWDQPEQVLSDPHWYGRSARYVGGDFIGAGKALTGAYVGGWKLLHDIASMADPSEYTRRPAAEPAQQVGRDIKGVASGIRDVGQDVWDLVRHFPEASSDPEHFGNTIMNAAMITDGSIKSAKSIAELFKADSGDAVRVSHNASNKAPSRFFKRKAFEDAYVHSKGLQVAKKVDKAASSIHEEIKTHAAGIESQIDTALPSGVIDAATEADLIKKEFADAVKAPEGVHPALRNMLADAKRTAPGQWTWGKTRQFRTNVGRSMGKVSGPQSAVLTRVYVDLTKKLSDVAKKHGLTDSWNHYNELERKTSHQFSDHIESIRNAQSGREVAGHLNRDAALTHEMAKNLSKYGLDVKGLQRFMKDSTRIQKQQKGWSGTLFRMAYGTPTGVPVMLATKAIGASWMGSVGAGALVGYASTALINAVRAARLSPEVIEHMMTERELPGPSKVSKGTFGTEAPQTPELPPPGVTPAPKELPPAQQAQLPPPKPAEKSEVPKHFPEDSDADADDEKPRTVGRWRPDKGSIPGEPREYLDVSEDDLTTAKAAIIEHESPKGTKYEAITSDGETLGTFDHMIQAKAAAESKFKKVPEGQHGKGKLAVRAKARERVSKAREGAKRTREAEVQEAQARAQATDMDVSQLQIPEMEEALKSMSPKALSGLQKLRKAKSITDPEYQEALRYYLLEAYEKRGGGPATEE